MIGTELYTAAVDEITAELHKVERNIARLHHMLLRARNLMDADLGVVRTDEGGNKPNPPGP